MQSTSRNAVEGPFHSLFFRLRNKSPWLAATLIIFALLFLMSSCAQQPDSLSSSSSSSDGTTTPQYISFTLKINDAGRIAEGGYYIILFNCEVDGIEVTNAGTFSDGIRLYVDPMLGPTHYWFHRIPSVPGPGYDMVLIARIDEYAQIAADWRSVTYTFSTTDSSVIFNQYILNRFTAHAMTTDNYANSVIGRIFDTMGPGPDISQNIEYTAVVAKDFGVEHPYPPNYPSDTLFDWAVKDDLPLDFPYVNFDIQSFQINVY